ncbi:hypothetical protein [Rhizobium sp. GCM10022189]|uniref:hypothetical protein n=1 Tax=Rhizobium sp. GCM10022189 TaxID=3252654 RepID=UPI0036071705
MPPIRKLLFGLFRNRIPAASNITSPYNEPDQSQPDIIAEIAATSAEGMDVNTTEPVGYATNRFRVEFFGVLQAVVKFNFSSMAVDISSIQVNEAERNQGICKAFIRSLYRAAQAGGFGKMELTASMDGRFVWAALGFRPTVGSWVVLKRHLLQRLHWADDRYPATHVEAIRQIIMLDDPRSLPLLADLPGDISDAFSPVGMICRILMSGPTWQGELFMGDPIDEDHLFR